MNHFTSLKGISIDSLENILRGASRIKERELEYLEEPANRNKGWWRYSMIDKVMVSLFYEPSTRTRHSFEAAMYLLGGNVIGTENAREFSSAIKGETLEDTIRVESSFGDLIVLRHPERGSADRAADKSLVPIINAGDGDGEHPTQTLVDLFTIFEKTRGEGLTLTLVGDLAKSRTVHSLLDALIMMRLHKEKPPCERIDLVSPSIMALDEERIEKLRDSGISFKEHTELQIPVLAESDVIYMTRTQKERWKDKRYDEWPNPEDCHLTKSLAGYLKDDAIVLHPLPRTEELPEELDDIPQAAWFDQAANGIYVRMAVILWAMGRLYGSR